MSAGDDFSGVVRVTLGFLVMYYVFLFKQSSTHRKVYAELKAKDPNLKYGALKYGKVVDKRCTTANRTVGNCMEQALPFVATLWMAAFVGGPEQRQQVAMLGWAYILFRAPYPYFFYQGGQYVLFSTLPGYAIIGRLAWIAVFSQ